MEVTATRLSAVHITARKSRREIKERSLVSRIKRIVDDSSLFFRKKRRANDVTASFRREKGKGSLSIVGAGKFKKKQLSILSLQKKEGEGSICSINRRESGSKNNSPKFLDSLLSGAAKLTAAFFPLPWRVFLLFEETSGKPKDSPPPLSLFLSFWKES